MQNIVQKFKETIFAVLPVALLVIFLHFTLAPIDTTALLRFMIGSVIIIVGLSIFLLGIDITITPVGQTLGAALVRRKSLIILVGVGFTVGFFINVAEPNLFVLATQVNQITGGLVSTFQLLLVAAFGIGAMIALGLARIIFQIPLRNLLLIIYLIIFGLCVLAPTDFIGVAFDASGAATGSMTVPFLLALGYGVSSVHGGKAGEEDSFGLTAVSAGGPVAAVLIMAIFFVSGGLTGEGMEEAAAADPTLLGPFVTEFLNAARDIALAISPIILITLLAQRSLMKFPRRAFRRVLIGFVYTYVGFVLFLTGVNAGFMDTGRLLGEVVGGLPTGLTIAVGGLIGLVVILAEPTVYVLTAQVEEITGGSIGKRTLLVVLALSVSAAVALTVFRIITPGVAHWHIFLIGYAIALILSRFAPTLFVGLAFDSGSVVSGPMTSTFVLAFAQGVAVYVGGPMGIVDAFSVIAFVALTPLIALQIFGLIYKRQSNRQQEEAEALVRPAD